VNTSQQSASKSATTRDRSISNSSQIESGGNLVLSPHSAPLIGLSSLSHDLTNERFVDFSTRLSLNVPLMQGWLATNSTLRRNSDAIVLSGRSGVNSELSTPAATPNDDDSIQRMGKKVDKYFVLYENADGEGPTIFSYGSEEAARLMQNEGVQTQQRYVRMKNVCSVHYSDPTLTASPKIYGCVSGDILDQGNPATGRLSEGHDITPEIESATDSKPREKCLAVSAFDHAVDYRWRETNNSMWHVDSFVVCLYRTPHIEHSHGHNDHFLTADYHQGPASVITPPTSGARPPRPVPVPSLCSLQQSSPPAPAVIQMLLASPVDTEKEMISDTSPVSPIATTLSNNPFKNPNNQLSIGTACSTARSQYLPRQPHEVSRESRIEIKTVDGNVVCLYAPVTVSSVSLRTWHTILEDTFDNCQI
jgi:hypothetical protein